MNDVTVPMTVVDDWCDDTTQVNTDVRDILSRLSDPTVELPLSEVNRQLLAAFPSAKPLEFDQEYTDASDHH